MYKHKDRHIKKYSKMNLFYVSIYTHTLAGFNLPFLQSFQAQSITCFTWLRATSTLCDVTKGPGGLVNAFWKEAAEWRKALVPRATG